MVTNRSSFPICLWFEFGKLLETILEHIEPTWMCIGIVSGEQATWDRLDLRDTPQCYGFLTTYLCPKGDMKASGLMQRASKRGSLIKSNRWPFQAKLEVSVPYLVGGLEHFFLVNLWLIYISGWWFGTMEWIMTFHILGILSPTDEHIFQRGRYTTNQICKDKEADPWRPR